MSVQRGAGTSVRGISIPGDDWWWWWWFNGRVDLVEYGVLFILKTLNPANHPVIVSL